MSLFLCMVWGCVLTLLIYMWPSNFPNTTCWRDYFFPIAYSCLFFFFTYILYFFFIFFICSEFCHTLKWKGLGFTCLPHPDLVFLCQRLTHYRCVGLFLGSLFCSINSYVCFCANIMLFWLLYLCSIVWSLGWLCLYLYSFFSRLLWQSCEKCHG